jgi:hypothetical protein
VAGRIATHSEGFWQRSKRLAFRGLQARLKREVILVEIVPLELLPEAVFKQAVQGRPRRGKGVKRTPKAVAGKPVR